ncbi:efflux RND transporter periplasmic adaptor subunit [Beijerinckia indica]|uniref:Efflux transporter, RND family, MFP subunit n=1 Tax=Beijerinckia indica subsp. indica (strain ATCC 9039 / DSM 1715 / NCIMB 8712) TaxID=395963 RepID=B2IJ48_BEII9|nr:efflux RND transporter periplasmic adaptor subunit [Beijerinckia indica]ACB94811.1 efflux transporter, RND family, MFP subunit [Beijerinckia indica subsp. indica ATCC 9039]
MQAQPSTRPRRSYLLPSFVALIVAAGGYSLWHMRASESSQIAAKGDSLTPAVPVQTTLAEQRDVPVYLTGIGHVQAFNTVTIKTRVDGQLQKVAFTEGQDVKAGDLLAQIDPRPYRAALDQAMAKKVQDEALLANARLDLQRYINLTKNDMGASRQQLDTQKAQVAQLEAQIRGDQALIENAQTQLGYTSITSPIDGEIGIRLVDQGNIVHASDTTGLVVVTQIHPISVIFTLPENQLDTLKTAMKSGPVTIHAMSRDGKQALADGKLAVLDNLIDQTTGTLRLKGIFLNQDGILWPGEFVSIRLLARTQPEAIIIPSTALQRGPEGYYVYAVKPDQTVEIRPLDIGQIANGVAIVNAGLHLGEPVVTAGQYRLAPGVRVEARTTQASR